MMPPSDRRINKSNSLLSRLRRSLSSTYSQKLTPNNATVESDGMTKDTIKTTKMQKRYRMVALDLDRTLLASDGTLADVQADYIRELSQRGFLICIATGRAAAGTFAYAAKLQIPRLPIVCSNGTSGFFWSQGNSDGPPIIEEEFQFPISKPIVKRAIKLANQHNFCIQYYYKNSIFANPKSKMHYDRIKRYSEIFGVSIDPVQDDFEELLNKNQLPTKLLFLFDSKDNIKARNVIHDEFHPSEANVVRGNSNWLLQILGATSNKGIGLKHMCDKLNVPLEEVIAIGDSFNDLEFLQMAGMGVAVKNAEPEIKQIADVNLDFTNDEYAPMRMLQELEEKGELIFSGKERLLRASTC